MAIAEIVRSASPGEIRSVAFDAAGDPVGLHIERPHASHPRLGERHAARIIRIDAGLGGAFVDLGRSGEGFLRVGPPFPSEGQIIEVEVMSEPHDGKLARVMAAPARPAGPCGFEAWRARLVGGAEARVMLADAADRRVADALSDALARDARLPGGGVLTIERVRALTAADIDTAGRRLDTSRPASRALKLNTEAAALLARQLLLRGLGGLVALDCVGPLNAASRAAIRDAFRRAWTALCLAPARVLPPSAFGLMEISIPWSITPVADRFNASRPDTQALEGLRALDAALSADRLARLTLRLPRPAAVWLAASGIPYEAELAGRYGQRFTVEPVDAPAFDLISAP